ncbi:phage tail protein, partial [Escherichia coli]|nr:phage tail protein [Escherichia coli]
MNRSDSPKKQPKPFGVNGQRVAILPTTPAGDNSASYEQGFPPITMILKSAGGLPPKGQDMNQILYELSALGRWSSTGALNTFDSEFASEISGYPSGAMLISNDGERIFINTTEGNLSDPNSNGTGWKDILSYLGLGDTSGYVGRWLNTRVFT